MLKIANFLKLTGLVLLVAIWGTNNALAEEKGGSTPMHDEASYTAYIEKTMKKLDKLYLEFCSTCNVDGAKANKARIEYYKTARDLLQQMNGRLDHLDPKKGAALSHTETLVSIHALTMLVDILTATQLENMTDNPHN